eukprot:16186731-Heterocapsa_arctica.AAC.1
MSQGPSPWDLSSVINSSLTTSSGPTNPVERPTKVVKTESAAPTLPVMIQAVSRPESSEEASAPTIETGPALQDV